MALLGDGGGCQKWIGELTRYKNESTWYSLGKQNGGGFKGASLAHDHVVLKRAQHKDPCDPGKNT